jgi:hypothetical protein
VPHGVQTNGWHSLSSARALPAADTCPLCAWQTFTDLQHILHNSTRSQVPSEPFFNAKLSRLWSQVRTHLILLLISFLSGDIWPIEFGTDGFPRLVYFDLFGCNNFYSFSENIEEHDSYRTDLLEISYLGIFLNSVNTFWFWLKSNKPKIRYVYVYCYIQVTGFCNRYGLCSLWSTSCGWRNIWRLERKTGARSINAVYEGSEKDNDI